MIAQKSKVKSQNSKFKIFVYPVRAFLIFILPLAFFILHSPVIAISPTVTPIASPSASLTPTTIEDEKVKELRDSLKAKAIQEIVDQIKEKIEKRAYVGVIEQITDQSLTLTNFRGKKRVRITETTKIINASKKEIAFKDLAVEDKIIALGTMADNEILEAKRVIVIPKPSSAPTKRLVFYGKISEIDLKKSILSLTAVKDLDRTLELKIDKTTNLASQADLKKSNKLNNLQAEQKVIAIYSEIPAGNQPDRTTTEQIPLAKSLFILP